MTTETTITWTNDYPQQHSKHMSYKLLPSTWEDDCCEDGFVLIGIDGRNVRRLQHVIGDRNIPDPASIAAAFWCCPLSAKHHHHIGCLCDDIVSAVKDSLGDDEHDRWDAISELSENLHDSLINALESISEHYAGRSGHDLRGICNISDDQVAWWHTGASSEWVTVEDCDDDQLEWVKSDD